MDGIAPKPAAALGPTLIVHSGEVDISAGAPKLIIDSGPLPQQKYYCGIEGKATAGHTTLSIQRRDAANAVTLEEKLMTIFAEGDAVGSDPYGMYFTLAAGERIRVESIVNAGSAALSLYLWPVQ